MDLRELKKEVHALPDFSEHLQKFQQNWIKPVRTNTNKHLPFLQKLPEEKNRKSTTSYTRSRKQSRNWNTRRY